MNALELSPIMIARAIRLVRDLAIVGLVLLPTRVDAQEPVANSPARPSFCASPALAPTSLEYRVRGTSVSLAWNLIGLCADAYVIEAGSSPGLSNIAIVEATERRLLADAPRGVYYIRVRVRTLWGTSAPSPEVRIVVSSGACALGGFVCIDPAPSDPGALANRVPLILIHGINLLSNVPQDDAWSALLAHIAGNQALRETYKPYVVTYWSHAHDLPRLAQGLQGLLDSFGANDLEFGRMPLVVVAHSMGGLLARHALPLRLRNGAFANQLLGQRVASLITLGTPHHGTPAANGITLLAANGAVETKASIALGYLWYTGLGPTTPNRSDLTWDNYNRRLSYAIAPAEQNFALAALNSFTTFDKKIIAYGGRIDPGSPTSAVQYRAGAELLLGDFGYRSDGLVPLQSSLFADAANQSRARLIRIFDGYDHPAMKAGHTDGRLVSNVGTDLLSLLPRPPVGLAMRTSGAQVLTWDPPSGGPPPQHYVIRAGSSPGSSNVSTGLVVPAAPTSLVVPPTIGPGTYYVRISSVTDLGESAPSAEFVLTVTSPPRPSATFIGRILIDTNGNNFPDPGESFAATGSTTCARSVNVPGLRVAWNGPVSGSAEPGQCIGDPDFGMAPAYHGSGVPLGQYALSLQLPSGWRQTSAYVANGTPIGAVQARAGENHVWFAIRPDTAPDAPAISGISPAMPTAGPNNQILSVNGARFESGLAVFVTYPGGTATLSGNQIQQVTPTSLQITGLLANPGTYTIRVNNPGGQQSNTFTFTVQAAGVAPSVASVSPTAPTAGPSNQTVSVSGANFQAGLTVTVGLPGGGTSTLSGSQIQGVSSNSFQMIITVANAGPYSIRVNNSNGLQSNTFNFTVQSAAVASSISSISPGTPTAGPGNQTVSVSGANFQGGLTVTVGLPGGGTSTLSGSQIQGVSSNSFQMIITVANAGNYSLRVNNPNGLQSNTFNFTVQSAAVAPSISSISPGTPTAGPGNQTVSVAGANFQAGLTVTVGLPGGGTSTLSGSQIQSVSSNSFQMIITVANAGNYNIRVNNPNGLQSNTFNFTVQSAAVAPNISSIAPSTPTAGPSNQTVSVSGANFQAGLTVTVGLPGGGTSTLSGSQIQGVSSNSFQMIITVANAGNYSIRVNNPNGLQSSTFGFTVQSGSPSIASISPSTPTASPNNKTVSVFGANFQSGLTVTVGLPGGGTSTLSGSQIQGVSSGSFQMIITVANPGNYSIRVNNPSGAQSNIFGFTVAP